VRRPPFPVLLLLVALWAVGLLWLGTADLRTFLPLTLIGVVAPVFLLFPETKKWDAMTGLAAVYGPLLGLAYLLSKKPDSHFPIVALLSLALVVLGIAQLSALKSLRKAAPWIILACIIGLFIANLSGEGGSAERMDAWYIRMFDLDPLVVVPIVRVIRKTIHISCYGVVAALMFKAFTTVQREARPAVVFAVLWALPHAIFDEWRQFYEPNRGASVLDVGIDMLGVAIFLVAMALVARRKEVCLQK